jgi:hypothetical protein
MERSDLEKVGKAIQAADERSRYQQCKCDWDYATEHGTQRAHNPLCPVHGLEPVAALPQSSPVTADSGPKSLPGQH